MRIKRRFIYLLLILCGVTLTGTLGYELLEGWSFFDSLYMTIITLATVGYGETHPLGVHGRIFTIFLILGGVGFIAYAIAELTSFLVEGELRGLLRARYMKRTIDALNHHYILCGVGRTGRYALEELQKTQKSFVIIEKNPEHVTKLVEDGHLVVEGDATEDHYLEAAGIKRAAGILCALSTDRDNLFVVISARGLNPTVRIISKIEEIHSRNKFLRSGADGTVSTNFIGGLRLASELIRPAAVSFLDQMLRQGNNLRVDEVSIIAEAQCVGQTLAECDIGGKTGALLLSIRKYDQYIFNPSMDICLENNDCLIVMGTPEQVAHARSIAGHTHL